MKSSLFTNTSVYCFFFLLVCDLSSRFKIVLVLLLRSGRKKNCINMFALFLFFIFHTITFCSVSKAIKCIKVKNKYAVSNKIEKNSSTDNINMGLWFAWLPISEMFCIFFRYFSTTCFQYDSCGKGIASFLLFRFFRILWNLRAYFPFKKPTGAKTCHLICSRSDFWWPLWGHQSLSLKNGTMVIRLLKQSYKLHSSQNQESRG